MLFAPRCWRFSMSMGIDASLWRGTTLKIHFFVGIHSLSMGAELIIGVFPASTVWMHAMAVPEEM